MGMADIQLEAFLIWERNKHLSAEDAWYQAEQVINQKCNLDLHQSDCESNLDVLWNNPSESVLDVLRVPNEPKKCCKGKKGCSNE